MELFYCNIDEFADLEGMSLLTGERRARAERCLKNEGKARCLTAGLLIRYGLGEEGASRLITGPNGKPVLEDGPCFNLSHSGKYVALGISRHELGVDVERIRPWQDRVARRCFTPAELDWLYAQGDEAAFFKLWTAKESVMKATGRGFSLFPSDFEILPVADGPHVVEGAVWHLRWLDIEGYAVCTACEADEPAGLAYVGREALLAGTGCTY